jgi:exopolysaccharide biosynthesis polyprenyl glycosylphosphotransferase
MVAFKLSDMLIMIGSFMAAAIMVSYEMEGISLDQFLNMRIKVENFILFFVILLMWHAIFSMFGLYRSRRLLTIKKEIKDIVKATSLGTFAIYILSLLFDMIMVTPVFLVSFWAGSTLITILTRLVMRYTLNWVRCRGRNLRYLLIVGTNSRALQFAGKIESQPELGYVISGFVDDKWEGNGSIEKSGWKLVSNIKGFTGFIRDNVVDEVLISLPVKSYYQETARILKDCEKQGILVRHLPNIFNTKHSKFKLENIEDHYFASHYRGSMEGWQVLAKGMLDRSLSLILLILFVPLFFLTALLIKITSSGPVFFIQDRVGLNKRRFRLYKFRSMVKDAELTQTELEDLNECTGAAFKIKNDPRITSIGRILRKTSIDELPQLINVLKGDMSLVGPRPLPVRDYNGFNKDWHRRRFSVRPGITCLWQVNGRSSIHFDKWMELDMEYIDHWSLLLDLKILIKTVPAVIEGSGAE